MRRCNIRILGIAEKDGSRSTISVLRLLKESIQLEKEVLLVPRRSDSRPRAIMAKLQYYQDCIIVLRRDEIQSTFFQTTLQALPRKLLHNRQGVRFGILFPVRLHISHDGKEN